MKSGGWKVTDSGWMEGTRLRLEDRRALDHTSLKQQGNRWRIAGVPTSKPEVRC